MWQRYQGEPSQRLQIMPISQIKWIQIKIKNHQSGSNLKSKSLFLQKDPNESHSCYDCESQKKLQLDTQKYTTTTTVWCPVNLGIQQQIQSFCKW